jgi:hypothetical protein
LPKILFHVPDLVAQGFHGRHGLVGRLPLALQTGHLVRALPELMSVLFDLRCQCSPFGDNLLEVGPGHVGAAASKPGPERIKIVAEVSEIVHVAVLDRRIEI